MPRAFNIEHDNFDIVIIGAGAAGLMCAISAGRRGRKVLLLDHSNKLAEKIRISGGGRCNFTNLNTGHQNYISGNPHFCTSALKRYTPHDFIALVKKYNIAFHEKTLGQLFCDGSSQQIIDMLLAECEAANVSMRLTTKVHDVSKDDSGFGIETSKGSINSTSLVIATGGLSIPKIGASGFGYDIARKFGLNIINPEAALVPFTLADDDLKKLQPLAGIAIDVEASIGRQKFREAMLFTHRGLSGPAILQISSYWQAGKTVNINLLPDIDVAGFLLAAKSDHPKQEIATPLAQKLPKRFAAEFCNISWPKNLPYRLADISGSDIKKFASIIAGWQITPSGTEGWRTAEVTRGGVDTAELSSKTFESHKVPGLYFIGEVVDVTGWLGGYNFQWAWASGHAAGQFA